MSYLTLPRIVFSGTFQSDVSTVNNDVRHYDNAAFEGRFQEPQTAEAMNGWWNPNGSGAFRLVDVAVRQSVLTAGDPGLSDPATGLFVNAQAERPAAKMVDLDPQFQMGSSLWGLRLILTDGQKEYLRGDYLAAPFRDLIFGRARQGGSGGASAKYTSVLTGVVFTDDADNSPVLRALKQAAADNDDTLAVNLMTYGYVTSSDSERFTFGYITGSIGTWSVRSPRKFVAGRRFAPELGEQNLFANSSNLGFFDGDSAGGTLSLDLSNALPLDNSGGVIDGRLVDVGNLHLGVLTKSDRLDAAGTIQPSVVEGDILDSSEWTDLGSIPYRDPDWLMKGGGFYDVALSTEMMAKVSERPLALLTPGQPAASGATVRIRETFLGLFLRADTMELRVDSKSDASVSASTVLYARQYGKPADKIPIRLALNPPESDQGGSGRTNPPAPQAPIPRIGEPSKVVHFPATGMTGGDGSIKVTLVFDDPKNTRGYIDGQIYKVNYWLDYQGVSRVPLYEQIVVHLRDAFEPVKTPDWSKDVEPILVQFGNLYPIMSKGLFSFSDPEVIKKHARIMAFALTRPLDDPNHMPVTRDLSEGKRQTILNWLAPHIAADESSGEAIELSAPIASDGAPLSSGSSDVAPIERPQYVGTGIPGCVAEGSDGKTQAVRDALRARNQVL